MMVVGESGLGKSTVVNSLFLSGKRKLIYSENLSDRPPIKGKITVTDYYHSSLEMVSKSDRGGDTGSEVVQRRLVCLDVHRFGTCTYQNRPR